MFPCTPADGEANSVGANAGTKDIVSEEEAAEATADLQSSSISNTHEYLLDDA
jgi:hypothetical protein